jgi:hypothetical protein
MREHGRRLDALAGRQNGPRLRIHVELSLTSME